MRASPLNPEVFNQIERQTGLRIHEGFGQSETSVLLANFPWVEIRPGSMGKPAPIYDIDLLDEDGNSCEDGTSARSAQKYGQDASNRPVP